MRADGDCGWLAVIKLVMFRILVLAVCRVNAVADGENMHAQGMSMVEAVAGVVTANCRVARLTTHDH